MPPLHNRKSNRLYFFIVGYTLVFGLLASLGYFGVRQLQEIKAEKTHTAAHEDLPVMASDKTLFRLPRMELTLSSLQGETHHARIGISLEIDKKYMERFLDYQPRVSDRVVDFLRHQDVDSLRNPTYMYNFRRDLLEQINAASGPVLVTDVIFREFIVR